MKERLKHQVFKIVSNIIEKQHLKAFVIGGFVRDLLLNRDCKDIDIVVVGSGIELAMETARAISPELKVNIFKNFGTAMFRIDDMEIEFVGARKESYSRNSRKPIVENGTLEDDQNRRDFTINALAISLCKENYGELIDPFGGLDDLKTKTIKTPLEPNITFSDDPLRMLRAIRFATKLNFNITDITFKAIADNKQRIQIISKERIVDELNKILLAPKPSIGFNLLFKSGLMDFILPELSKLKGVDIVEGKGHKDNFYHTLHVVDNIAQRSDNLWLRWAGLLHDIGKPATKKYTKEGWTFHGHDFVGSQMVVEIFRKLRLPQNEKMKYVQKLVALHLRPIALTDEEVTDSAIRRIVFDAGDDIDDLMILCEADITSKDDGKVKKFLENFKIVREKIKEVEQKDSIRNFQPPITGQIVMETFDLKPSKIVGIIKDGVKDAILDGIIPNNFEKSFEYMLQLGEQHGLKPVKIK